MWLENIFSRSIGYLFIFVGLCFAESEEQSFPVVEICWWQFLLSLKSTMYTQKSAHTPYLNFTHCRANTPVLSSSSTSFLCEEMQLILKNVNLISSDLFKIMVLRLWLLLNFIHSHYAYSLSLESLGLPRLSTLLYLQYIILGK